ncbi:MAG: DUF1015 domain-containing protein [Alphaproteobacteria bacterium]|nr:DUF1015 domain-containing protein [Alphaproteobacteria bacterium]
MPLFRPFKAVRPAPEFAAEVVAPPYDVLDTKEAREKASGKPYSFLHISKAEIDLPEDINPYDPAVYAKSAENYQALLHQGILMQEDKPCYYVYRAVMGEHTQTGLAVAASVEAYDAGKIRRHEFTRVEKEDDRVRQIDALKAQTGPALLAYHQIPEVDQIIKKTVQTAPLYKVTADHGIHHLIWKIDNEADLAAITAAFNRQEVVYIADGHHRSAAASRVAKKRAQANPKHTGLEDYNFFLAVAFPIEEMKILDYNRIIRDLNGLSPAAFLKALKKDFIVTPSEAVVKPKQKNTFGLYTDGKWYLLTLKNKPETTDPVKLLDVSLLSDLVLTPILGIQDLRKDKRIDFVGGMRGLKELENRVNNDGFAAAFALYPTQMNELTAVADTGQVMPPKSTWFEPKLTDGLLSNPI